MPCAPLAPRGRAGDLQRPGRVSREDYHAHRRTDQARFERGDKLLFVDGVVWRCDAACEGARASAEAAAGRQQLHHQYVEPIRLSLPGSYIRVWHEEHGEALGASIVEEAVRKIVIEPPPSTLRDLIDGAARDEVRPASTSGLSRQTQKARTCRMALDRFGLVPDQVAQAHDEGRRATTE